MSRPARPPSPSRLVPFLVGVRAWAQDEASIAARLEAHLLRLRAAAGARRPAVAPSAGDQRREVLLRRIDAHATRHARDGWDQHEAEELAASDVAGEEAQAELDRLPRDVTAARREALRGKVTGRVEREAQGYLGEREARRHGVGSLPRSTVGTVLSRDDKARISRRAQRLIAARDAAGRPPAGLREDDRRALLARAGGVRLAGPASAHAADELAAALLGEMPWMAGALRHVWRAARRSAAEGRGLAFAPLLVAGPPGVGKSHLARRLADLAGAPLVSIDVGASSEGFRVGGLTRGWSSACPGAPVEAILATGVGNPVVFVDEIDKGGTHHASRGGAPTSAWTSLLGLLEPGTAARWTCPFFGVALDMSRVCWVLAANDLAGLPAPLLSRLRVVRVNRLTSRQLADVARREGLRLGLDGQATEDLARAVERCGAGLDLRAVLRLVEDLADREGRYALH